jgi:hypothetical protein
MGKRGSLSGGGIESRQVVNTNNPKAEPTNHSVSMNRPSMIGMQHWQNDAKGPLYNKQPFTTPIGTRPSVAGPGGGRMVMKSGSQSATPKVSDPPRGKNHW